MQTNSAVYTVITYQIFGGIETVETFSSKNDAEANVVEWANKNAPDMEQYKTFDEAMDYFADSSDENMEVTIRLFENTVIGEGSIKTLSCAKALIGEVVNVLDNDETTAFSGLVIDASENDVDGILVSVNDQNDNTWDIEARYIVLSETVSNSATAVFIESLQGETATVEVVECSCGYHMGIDSTFLDQVSDMKVSCPSCGATINTALIPEISHDDCDDNLNAIYEKFNHMASNWFQSAKVGDVVYNKIDLDFSIDEVLELIKEDDCSVVVSLYSEDNDSVKDLYFDAFELARAEFSEDKIVMKAESGEKFTIEFSGLNKTKAIAVNSSSNKELYLVTIDHVEGPCTQLCDTEANAKAFVFGHITSYDTFEEFDTALKGSIDAIEGLINYTIEKHGCGKMRIEPAVEMRPRYSIVMSVNNKESGTFEDYVNEETAIEAFESIRKNGYHIPEGEFGDLNEKITFEQYGRVEFSMDVELWDNYNNHHGFGIIEHTRIVMINGVVQNG